MPRRILSVSDICCGVAIERYLPPGQVRIQAYGLQDVRREGDEMIAGKVRLRLISASLEGRS